MRMHVQHNNCHLTLKLILVIADLPLERSICARKAVVSSSACSNTLPFKMRHTCSCIHVFTPACMRAFDFCGQPDPRIPPGVTIYLDPLVLFLNHAVKKLRGLILRHRLQCSACTFEYGSAAAPPPNIGLPRQVETLVCIPHGVRSDESSHTVLFNILVLQPYLYLSLLSSKHHKKQQPWIQTRVIDVGSSPIRIRLPKAS